MADQVVVRGYTEFLRALKDADKNTKREVRLALREAGDSVRVTAAQLAGDRFHNAGRTAAGYRVRVRQRGVAVEQSVRKTTGKRPDFGGLQMRYALEPALDRNEARIEEDFEAALDRVSDIFNHGG